MSAAYYSAAADTPSNRRFVAAMPKGEGDIDDSQADAQDTVPEASPVIRLR